MGAFYAIRENIPLYRCEVIFACFKCISLLLYKTQKFEHCYIENIRFMGSG